MGRPVLFSSPESPGFPQNSKFTDKSPRVRNLLACFQTAAGMGTKLMAAASVTTRNPAKGSRDMPERSVTYVSLASFASSPSFHLTLIRCTLHTGIFGVNLDGSDVTQTCSSSGCGALQPEDWVCFSSPLKWK